MNFLLYSFFIWIYRIGVLLLSPWNPKARHWLQGRIGIFSRLKSAFQSCQSEIIWMHCASLGEFEQGLPILEKLKVQYPAAKILVTFFSSSGYELKKDNDVADFIFYLPSDSKKNAEEFVGITNPKLVLWVKNNYWFYYLQELKKKNIPVLLVSGVFREDQPFFAWYGRIYRLILPFFNHFFVQSEASKKLLGTLGISTNVSIAGDTRFDRVIEIAGQFKPIDSIEEFCGKNIPVIVAGNTWEEDEEELDHYANAHPEIRFIIAPHSMDEEGLRDTKRLFRNSIYFSV
jgi:3-deoxy-D-manno-octulosonic-acid transferase